MCENSEIAMSNKGSISRTSSYKMVSAWECTTRMTESCCLCDLPKELLEIIISHLSVLDYLSCRVVSKCSRSAFSFSSCTSSETTTFLNLAPNQQPWFLILSTEKPPGMDPLDVPCPCYLTTGRFGNLATGKIYTTTMPELCGTFLLLSKHGWLLLFSTHSLFFFDMFSKARITLPFMNVAAMFLPVFEISAPPTSPDCQIFVISLVCGCYVVRFCSRKDLSWTTLLFMSPIMWNPEVRNVTFAKGIWYCFHDCEAFSTFDPANRSMKFLDQPRGMTLKHPGDPNVTVSYVVNRGDQVCLRVHGRRHWYEIALMDPLRIVGSSHQEYNEVVQGNIRADFAVEHLLRTDVAKATKSDPTIAMDSFNADAWCGSCGSSNGAMTFRWHRFLGSKDDTEIEQCQTEAGSKSHEERCCVPNNFDCSTIIRWVTPTGIHSSSNLSWRL